MNAAATGRRFSARQFAVFLIGFCCFINLYSPQAILPLLSTEFGAGGRRNRQYHDRQHARRALTAPFTRHGRRRVGRKRVIVTAMFALAVPCLMVALGADADALVGWRFNPGPGNAADLRRRHRLYRRGMAAARSDGGGRRLYIRASLGGFSGRFVTGILADAVGWRDAFVALAAIAFVGAVCSAVAAARAEIRALGRTACFGPADAGALPQSATWCDLCGRLRGTVQFHRHFTYISFRLAAPPYDLSASSLGTIFVVYIFGTALTPLSGWVVGRFGRRRFMIANIGGLDRRYRADARRAALGDPARTHALRRRRHAVPGDLHRLCDHHSAGGAVLGGGLYVTSFYFGGSLGAALGGVAWTLGGCRPASSW